MGRTGSDGLTYGNSEAVKTPTDEQLLADFLAGKSENFELLVRRHSGELYRFLARFAGSASAAEDLVQETFLQVYLSGESFDRTRRFKPWLFTIAANKARDMLRSKGRRPEVPIDAQIGGEGDDGQRFLDFMADDSELPETGLERSEEQELIRSLLQELPEHLREVLVLGYYHKFAYKDIADILGVPLGTVKSRLHAAVGRLGQAYKAVLNERESARKGS